MAGTTASTSTWRRRTSASRTVRTACRSWGLEPRQSRPVVYRRLTGDFQVSVQLDRLKGSIPPLVTPFNDGEVDYEAYARLVAFQIKNGSHGILVNGTTAEPSTLSVEERNRLVDIAVQVAAGKVPVVAATGSQSLRETRELTEHAAKAGVDSLLIVTPYYIRPPQRGLIAYYLELASLTNLPWMVYHIPGRAAVNVTIDTLKELRAKSPNFVGMKHAVNDLALVSECHAGRGPES